MGTIKSGFFANRPSDIPWPFAPFVFVTEETTEADLRRYLRDLRECGFDCLRFGGEGGCGVRYLGEDRYDFSQLDLIFDLAEEAGLRIIPNLRVGYADWMSGPPHLVHRDSYLLDDEYHRLIDKYVAAAAGRYRHRPCLLAYEGVGEPGGFPEAMEQDPRFVALFTEWLQQQYGTLANLSCAWGYGGPLLPGLDSWEAWRGLRGTHFEKYRHRRDLARFKTELLAERMTRIERCWQQHDPAHPVLTGVHQLLGNAAVSNWDFELQASRADGFFSSIHAGWHFWILPGEFLLPLYVQARLTRDLAKGKWALPYETTGGPNFRSALRQHNMQAGEHLQMMLCYLAAGLQGIGLWAWNCRLSGPEAGEYGLTTLQGQPSRRARLLGELARHVRQYRGELAEASSEPRAAILYSWEAEMFASQRDMGPLDGSATDENSRRRLGAARALLNRNIPFEFITDNELVAGRADGYPTLVVPGMALVRRDVMAALGRYVEGGGRLVADAPFATFDEHGRVRVAGSGGEFDRLVGAFAVNHFHAQHEPRRVHGLPLAGQFSEVEPTRAEVIARLDDGRPATLCHSLGAGQVVYFAHEVASRCFRPGNAAWETTLADAVLGSFRPGWQCDGAVAFRRRHAAADHYFLINPTDTDQEATLTVADATYDQALEVVANRTLPVCRGQAGTRLQVVVPGGQGIWLRCPNCTSCRWA
ncbi:MAG: Beta-galactosidase BglY [Lentisphaerae bacterium ADurb.BinA184]|nr:MAG: Beta-galactosidase BglY [Lentisphaerae bacterium ADurb.BinA184]